MNRERLLNVARALRESPNPEMFTMDAWGHACGTPACALGHYANRDDLQSLLRLNDLGDLEYAHGGRDPWIDDSEILEHFGITTAESYGLFAAGCGLKPSSGCGSAKTAIEAAEYIERWVAAREQKP